MIAERARLVVGGALRILLATVLAAGMMALVGRCVGGCAPLAAAAEAEHVTAEVVTVEQAEDACINQEDLDKCRADKAACRRRIDTCRANVRAAWLDGGL